MRAVSYSHLLLNICIRKEKWVGQRRRGRVLSPSSSTSPPTGHRGARRPVRPFPPGFREALGK